MPVTFVYLITINILAAVYWQNLVSAIIFAFQFRWWECIVLKLLIWNMRIRPAAGSGSR